MGSETRPGGGFEHVCWIFHRHLCRMRVFFFGGGGRLAEWPRIEVSKMGEFWSWVSECVGKGVLGWVFWQGNYVQSPLHV